MPEVIDGGAAPAAAMGFWLGPFCALLSSLTWAFGSTRYSQLASRFSPFSINFARALVAAPLFVAATFLTNGAAGIGAFQAIHWQSALLLGVSMVASYGLADALFFWSTQALGVPGALAIASAYPLWTTVAGGAPFALKEMSGVILTLAGVIAVILGGPRQGTRRSDRPSRGMASGVALAVATSFLWAVNSTLCAHVSPGLSAPAVNAVRMLFALATSAFFGRLLAPRSKLLLPREVFFGSFWVFGYEAFGGSLFFIYGLGHSPLAIGVTLTALAPVLAVPIAWVFRTEKLSWRRTAGVLVVVAGLCLLLWRS